MATKYQFQIDGRSFNSTMRDNWYEAAQDAVSAGYAIWSTPHSIKLDTEQGAEIARVVFTDAD